MATGTLSEFSNPASACSSRRARICQTPIATKRREDGRHGAHVGEEPRAEAPLQRGHVDRLQRRHHGLHHRRHHGPLHDQAARADGEHDHRGHEARPPPGAARARGRTRRAKALPRRRAPGRARGRGRRWEAGQESPGVLQVEEHRDFQEVRPSSAREAALAGERSRHSGGRALGRSWQSASIHDFAGVLRQRGAQLQKMGRGPRGCGPRAAPRRRPLEREAAAQQTVGDHSQAVDVGPRRQGPSPRHCSGDM